MWQKNQKFTNGKEALFLKGTYEASVLSERKYAKRELSTVRLSPKRERSLEEICASCLKLLILGIEKAAALCDSPFLTD